MTPIRSIVLAAGLAALMLAPAPALAVGEINAAQVDNTLTSADVAANFLSADATGRALFANDFWNAATVLTKFDADSLDAANLVLLVADDAFAASAAARGLFATGFFDAATVTDLFAAGSITATELATSAVATAEILNGTIIAEDLATGAVTTTGILDATITTTDISASAAITGGQLASATLTGAQPAIITQASAGALAAGSFGYPLTLILDVPAGATNNVDFTTLPFAVRIIDVFARKVGNSADAGDTVALQTGAGVAISNTLSLNVNDGNIVRASNIALAQDDIAAAGTIRARRVQSTDAACVLYVTVVKM